MYASTVWKTAIRDQVLPDSAQIWGDGPSTEFALHRLVTRFQFGHELHELGAGAHTGEVWVAGEQRIVRHARFRGLAQPAHGLTALALERENRCERVKGGLRVAELLHFV